MYEKEMSVQYDDAAKKVIVWFRGRKVVLPGCYPSREKAMRAAEEYCRRLGWQE